MCFIKYQNPHANTHNLSIYPHPLFHNSTNKDSSPKQKTFEKKHSPPRTQLKNIDPLLKI